MSKIILWNYERGTWQYDVFCLLIIAFIFLTPKAWFAGKEKSATPRMLSAVKAKDFSLVENKFENSNLILSNKQITDHSNR